MHAPQRGPELMLEKELVLVKSRDSKYRLAAIKRRTEFYMSLACSVGGHGGSYGGTVVEGANAYEAVPRQTIVE